MTVDAVLRAELRRPGTDDRHSVCLIARPPDPVREVIARMHHRLRGLEDGQDYYPPGDLHMITSGATWYRIARRIACAGPLGFGG